MVLVRVQHHPSREDALARLLSGLDDARVEVLEHSSDPPSPWAGYQRCLSTLPPAGHIAVLQDDTIVCQNFIPALDLIAAANPDAPVVLFCGGLPRRTAHTVRVALGRASYVDLSPNEFLPVVAVLWPVRLAAAFLEWTVANQKRMPGTAFARSDDAIGGRWVRFTRQRVRVTVPSLVQHPDDVASTIGKRARAGADRSRVAACWIGDGDPLDIDWS